MNLATFEWILSESCIWILTTFFWVNSERVSPNSINLFHSNRNCLNSEEIPGNELIGIPLHNARVSFDSQLDETSRQVKLFLFRWNFSSLRWNRFSFYWNGFCTFLSHFSSISIISSIHSWYFFYSFLCHLAYQLIYLCFYLIRPTAFFHIHLTRCQK